MTRFYAKIWQSKLFILIYFKNRELLIKILELAFKSTDIIIQSESLNQITSLIKIYYSNNCDFKNINEENEGLG